MRARVLCGLRIILTASLVVGAMTAQAVAADGVWAFEVRVLDIVPIDDDGDLTVPAPIGTSGRHGIDFLDAVVPELALSAQVTEKFALSLSAALANFDVELDVEGAGTFLLGDADMSLVQLAGLFDVAVWNGNRVRLGPILAYATFDNIDISDVANARANVGGAPLDSDMLFGAELRLDSEIGRSGWYFSSNVRYLSGGPTMEVFINDPSSGAFRQAARGDVDFDPLLLALGFGYRY
ncbi:MAG: hypothetical protein JSV80_18530 [Acidobacteriota bacterium]|nr:MAG: hypothetical protein JSV80_18530 [Acidobacteriota bacterium]